MADHPNYNAIFDTLAKHPELSYVAINAVMHSDPCMNETLRKLLYKYQNADWHLDIYLFVQEKYRHVFHDVVVEELIRLPDFAKSVFGSFYLSSGNYVDIEFMNRYRFIHTMVEQILELDKNDRDWSIALETLEDYPKRDLLIHWVRKIYGDVL